jgi:hypothetical protein
MHQELCSASSFQQEGLLEIYIFNSIYAILKDGVAHFSCLPQPDRLHRTGYIAGIARKLMHIIAPNVLVVYAAQFARMQLLFRKIC